MDGSPSLRSSVCCYWDSSSSGCLPSGPGLWAVRRVWYTQRRLAAAPGDPLPRSAADVMTKSKKAYLLMVWFAILFVVYVVYVLYANFVHDPQATAFLRHKTDLKRALHVAAWLNVMRVHIVFACVSMLTGVINFSARMRKKYRTFHRVNGYLYVASVAIVVTTSGYMAPYATGGKISSMGFNLLNILWMLMTIIAIVKIRKNQVNLHRKWMARSYAFVFTNLSIHLLTSLFHDGLGLAYVNSYTISVYGTIVLLLLTAEFVIATAFRKTAPNI